MFLMTINIYKSLSVSILIMESYKLQFTVKDVLAVMQTWQETYINDEERKSNFCANLIHHFNGYVVDVVNLDILINKGLSICSDEARKKHYEELYLQNIFQRAYAHNILNLSINYSKEAYKIVYFEPDKSETLLTPSAQLQSAAEDFYHSLEELVQYLPMTSIIEQVAPLTPKQKKRCIFTDTNLSMLIYFVNKIFSPSFQRTEYYLKEDVKIFYDNLSELLDSERINLRYRSMWDISTSADYFTHAIEPLIWNVFQHGFNPANDVHGRINGTQKFWKSIDVNGYPEQEIDVSSQGSHGYTIPADSSDYIVVVKDNGFGIQPDILPHIFEKGFTTKQDKEGHGIGLWGVKEFVEQNKGVISVETKLDDGTASEHGTTFKFTIPYYYDHAKSICVQKR